MLTPMRTAGILRCCLGFGLMVVGYAIAEEQLEDLSKGQVVYPELSAENDAAKRAFSQPEAPFALVIHALAQLTGKKVIMGFNGPCDPMVFNLTGQEALSKEEKIKLITRMLILEQGIGLLDRGSDALYAITSQIKDPISYPCPKVIHSLNELPTIDSPGKLTGILIPLQHLTPKEAKGIAYLVGWEVTGYVSEHKGNQLECVSKSCQTLRKAYQLVHSLDAPAGTFVYIRVKLYRQSCEDVLKEAMKASVNQGQPPFVSGLEGIGKWRLIALPRTNDVLVLGPSSGFEQIKDLLEKLDHS